jgi:hypothetical protein
MKFASDFVQTKETELRADAMIALAIAKDTRLSTDTLDTFNRRTGHRYTKAAADILQSTDDNVANMFGSAFLAAVERESLAGQIVGAARASLGTASRIQTAAIVGTVVGEGAVKPISELAFSVERDPKKVSAVVVASTEALRSFSEADQAALRRVLVSAVAVSSDDVLIDVLTAGSPHGSALPGALLAQLGNVRRPVLVGSYLELVPLAATLTALRELGIQILASPSAAGKLVAFDASALLIASDPIRVDVARDANITLTTTGSPADDDVVNLFARNLRALRAEQFVQFAIHPSAVAWSPV